MHAVGGTGMARSPSPASPLLPSRKTPLSRALNGIFCDGSAVPQTAVAMKAQNSAPA